MVYHMLLSRHHSQSVRVKSFRFLKWLVPILPKSDTAVILSIRTRTCFVDNSMKCRERKQHWKHFKIINVIRRLFRSPMPPNLTLLSTPPQPSLLAYVYKVTSGWGRLMGLCSDLAEFIHHCRSLRHNSDSCIKASKLPLFRRKASVLSNVGALALLLENLI